MKTYAEVYKKVVRCTLEAPDDLTPEFASPTMAVLVTKDTGIPTSGGVFTDGKFYKPGEIAVAVPVELKVPLTQDQRDVLLIGIAKVYGITGD